MYIPIQVNTYLAAFAGALAGLAKGAGNAPSPLGSSTSATYQFIADVADAFAQSFDQAYSTVGTVPSAFEQETIAELSEAAWEDRGPANDPTATTSTTYDPETLVLAAVVTEGVATVAAQGVPIGDIWTVYTPTFNTQNADGALGDGVIIGTYKIDGDTLYYSIFFEAGLTTNFGTGNFVFGLPTNVTIDNGKMTGFGYMLSSGVAIQASVANASFPLLQAAAADLGPPLGNSLIFIISNSATGALLDGTAPFAWAPSDLVIVQGSVALI
jgi:hypothetical protein